MKNQFLMIIFCLISNVAYSMSIDLDDASKVKLIEQVKLENVNRNYWGKDVTVTLEKFYKIPGGNSSDTKYFVRAVGRYRAFAIVEYPENEYVIPIYINKGTEGLFSKEELEALGMRLP